MALCVPNENLIAVTGDILFEGQVLIEFVPELPGHCKHISILGAIGYHFVITGSPMHDEGQVSPKLPPAEF